MKIAITGHTEGLGKVLYQYFENKGHTVLGFSRSNGYNISIHQDAILEEAQHCDVFINNAFCKFAQVDLLYTFYNCWKNKKKHIINISSNSSDGIKKQVSHYAVYKAALDKASEQLSYQQETCKVTNIKPGWIDVPRIQNDEAKINPLEIAVTIDMILNTNMVITEMRVLPCPLKD